MSTRMRVKFELLYVAICVGILALAYCVIVFVLAPAFGWHV